MKIRTVFDREEARPTSSGDQFKIAYERVDHDDGSWSLVEVSKINIQKMINSAAPPSLADILARARRGDDTLLHAVEEGRYDDISPFTSGDLGDVMIVNSRTRAALEAAKVQIDSYEQRKAAEEKEGVNDATSA